MFFFTGRGPGQTCGNENCGFPSLAQVPFDKMKEYVGRDGICDCFNFFKSIRIMEGVAVGREYLVTYARATYGGSKMFFVIKKVIVV